MNKKFGMLNSEQNIQNILLDQEYTSTSNKTAKIFASAMDEVFLGFGETLQNGLISEAEKQTLPNKFKFPYYSLVEKTVLDFAGRNAGKKILQKIQEELTKQTKIDGTIEEILNEISKREVFERIDSFSGKEHVLFLWENERNRDDVFTRFFSKENGPKGAITNESSPIPNIKNITYEEIFQDKLNSIKHNRGFIQIISENQKLNENTRIAGTDGTNWFKQGLGKEILLVENEFEGYISEQSMSAICAYNLKKIQDNSTLKSLLSCHKFVLLENPFVIYERGN